MPGNDENRQPPPGMKRWPRQLGGAALGFCAAILLLQALLNAWEIPERDVELHEDGPAASFNKIAALRAEQLGDNAHRVFLLGNSLLMPGASMQHNQAVPRRLVQKLRSRFLEGADAVWLNAYRRPGQGYSTYYFLADQLIDTDPDQIVIEFDLISMSADWRTRWSNPEHVAFIGTSRIPEALSLPLGELGLTTDRVLWTVLSKELGGLGTWRSVLEAQGRVATLRDELHLRTASLFSSDADRNFRDLRQRHAFRSMAGEPLASGMSRLSRETYLEIYEDALAGVDENDISIEMTAATVHRFVRAGIATLVFVGPINVEHMTSVDALDREDLASSIARLGNAVRQAGGRFADLHDLLADEQFRDAAGHLTYEGPNNGTDVLAGELATLIIEQMEQGTGGTD